jgi:hypothetical protein
MITFRCPECNREARANDEHAGKKAKCPGCGAVFQIPADGGTAKPASKAVAPSRPKAAAAPPPEPPRPPARAAAARSRPPEDEEDEEDIADAEAAEEEEDDDQNDFEFDKPSKKSGRSRGKSRGRSRGRSSGRKGRPGAWAPCPSCGSDDATQQHFTWWGGFIGPMIINSVRCNDCGTVYNGVHGDSNTNRILIYCLVPLAILVVLGVVCGGLSAILGLE